MVLELRILFGVEHFEQRRRRIAAEILAELVDLVEQEQRVHRAGLFKVGHDLARQRADLGAAVTANLGLVAPAAQRLAHEFHTGSLGNRKDARGLAAPRTAEATKSGEIPR